MNNIKIDNKNINKDILLNIIQEVDKKLEGCNCSPFSADAFSILKEKIYQYISELMLESINISKRYHSDTISKNYIEKASLYLYSSKSGKFFKNIGMVGGILLGVSVSNIISTLALDSISTGEIILPVILGFAGIFMVTLSMVKG